MTRVIGIDFDNTLVTYDALIHTAALERGLIDPSTPAIKRAVRDRIRLRPDGEVAWQHLQALVYGPLMPAAALIDGAAAFVRECRRRGWVIFIVSHKTEFAGYDSTRTNLRDAARSWMAAHGFFDPEGLGLAPADVFFEGTREEKVARIRALGCTHFIDDLEEVFREPLFPDSTERLLFAPDAPAAADPGIRVMADWRSVSDYLFVAADLDAICRAHLGRAAADAERIGAGRNARVFRVGLSPAETAAADVPDTVVVKFYRCDADDTRDRLAAEFGGLQFLWENGVRTIARPIAADRDRCCGIYEYIAGTIPASIDADDIDQAVAFLSALRPLGARPGGARLPAASEAHFSITGIVSSVTGRLERLRRCGRDGDGRALHAWIDTTLQPLVDDVITWCRDEADASCVPFDADIDGSHRALSPSDFGFHNAIRRPDGVLAFVDFEYFGWDDPAKTAADFVLHPGMALDVSLGARFVKGFLASFADVPQLPDRLRIVYPIFGLKWCLILLNDFLPVRAPTSDAATVRRAQLAKADAMAARVRREFRANPYS